MGVAATPRHQRETTWMAGHENAPRVPLPPQVGVFFSRVGMVATACVEMQT